MKRSIVHYDYSIFRKAWQKPLFKSEFKQRGICCSIVLHGCNDLITHLSSNDICSLEFPSGYGFHYFFSARGVAIFTMQTLINSRFIHISYLFRINIFNLFLILLYFFWILFFVMNRLFFRVILLRFSALLIA